MSCQRIVHKKSSPLESRLLHTMSHVEPPYMNKEFSQGLLLGGTKCVLINKTCSPTDKSTVSTFLQYHQGQSNASPSKWSLRAGSFVIVNSRPGYTCCSTTTTCSKMNAIIRLIKTVFATKVIGRIRHEAIFTLTTIPIPNVLCFFDSIGFFDSPKIFFPG